MLKSILALAIVLSLGACTGQVVVARGPVTVNHNHGSNDIAPSTLNPTVNPTVDATVTDPNVQVNGAGDLSR